MPTCHQRALTGFDGPAPSLRMNSTPVTKQGHCPLLPPARGFSPCFLDPSQVCWETPGSSTPRGRWGGCGKGRGCSPCHPQHLMLLDCLIDRGSFLGSRPTTGAVSFRTCGCGGKWVGAGGGRGLLTAPWSLCFLPHDRGRWVRGHMVTRHCGLHFHSRSHPLSRMTPGPGPMDAFSPGCQKCGGTLAAPLPRPHPHSITIHLPCLQSRPRVAHSGPGTSRP